MEKFSSDIIDQINYRVARDVCPNCHSSIWFNFATNEYRCGHGNCSWNEKIKIEEK
jgi:hypothetical protein